jgi:hypothetical protein
MQADAEPFPRLAIVSWEIECAFAFQIVLQGHADKRQWLRLRQGARHEATTMELSNSKRLLYTANCTVTKYTPDEQKKIELKPGAGYPKSFMMRSLALQPKDLDRLQGALGAGGAATHRDEHGKLVDIALKLSSLRNQMSMMELAESMAPISYDALTDFVSQVVKLRPPLATTAFLLTWSQQRRRISPVGRQHLERVEMYSAGVQKGEFVFTVPMAPMETITISHKEWSTSSREFEEIVQDYFEIYSERGVAKKSDAPMSTEDESKHSNALNFGASLSGSYSGVSFSSGIQRYQYIV